MCDEKRQDPGVIQPDRVAGGAIAPLRRGSAENLERFDAVRPDFEGGILPGPVGLREVVIGEPVELELVVGVGVSRPVSLDPGLAGGY